MTTADPIGALREATRTMLQWQHRTLRTVINSLSADALNWTPVPTANSMAAIVIHTLDAERELVAAAAGPSTSTTAPSAWSLQPRAPRTSWR